MRGITLGALSVLFLAATSSVALEPDLSERALLDGHLTLQVPAAFSQMSKEMMSIKYPAERRPTIVLTNPEGSVNVAVNHTKTALQPHQVGEAHAALEKLFRNMYPSAKWYQSEVTSINGRDFFVLDVRTPAMDTEIRNIIGGTTLDSRFLIVTFNCTRELESAWVDIGRRILESASVSE